MDPSSSLHPSSALDPPFSLDPSTPLARICGYCGDRGMPRMKAAGIVFIIAAATVAPSAMLTRQDTVAATLAHWW